MTMGIVGRKCGMTRVFTEDGASVPVTVIEALPNRVAQVKTEETDGYRAVQVTLGARKPSRLTRLFWGLAGALVAALVSLAAWSFVTDLMARYPNDDARGEYSKEPVWPEDKMPDVQTNQCLPYLEWHMPKELKTKAIQQQFTT